MLIDTINKTKLTKGVFVKLAILVVLYFGVLYAWPYVKYVGSIFIADTAKSFENYNERQLVVGESTFTAYVADTEETRERGLSGQPFLHANEAMLFVFESPMYHGIWMKDMNFSIDIVWVNPAWQVVHIEENVSPSTYPKVFRPDERATHVIELKAGTVSTEGIKKGDRVEVL